MGTFRLRVGFPETTPVQDALGEALADWREACQRAGWTPTGEPSVMGAGDYPERAALGEYVIDVLGEYVDV